MKAVQLCNQGQKAVLEGVVASYDCDRTRQITPLAIMRYCQELADSHSAQMGMDFETMMEKRSVFLLAKISLTFYQRLPAGAAFRAVTYHRGTQGLQHLRDTVFYSGTGLAALHATSAWTLVDPVERRLLRPQNWPALPLVSLPQEALGTERLGRIHLPADMALAGQRQVRYSDIDCNGHMNNCVYAQLIMDYMPAPLAQRSLATLDIHFKNEAMEGETLSIYTAQQGSTVYFQGQQGGSSCFEAVCSLA